MTRTSTGTVSIGKWRRLQRLAGPCGAFCILAIDHRGPLRRMLEKAAPGGGGDAALVELKLDIVRHLGPISTAVLLDPETGAGQCAASGALPGSTGLIAALDTGSTGDPAVRSTGLIEGWSPEKAARMGADGAKLLVYYHPQSPQAAGCEQLVRDIAAACEKTALPLFLEPILHFEAAGQSPPTPRQRLEAAVETARRLAPLGADVLKLEFPAPDDAGGDAWLRACEQVSGACAAPWVLLSGGAPFEVFLRQVEAACERGASGVMAGRSVWDGAATPDRGRRLAFLQGEAAERLRRLREVCDRKARPFTASIRPPDVLPGWHAAAER